VVVKTDVLKQHPGVAKSLFEAFVSAKRIYLDALERGEGDSADDRKYRGLMPLVGDPLPYGLKDNAASIDAMLTYGLQQELVPRRMPLDEVFADPS
jgi:4,5-dihydroxyphthalate decarboxylase